MPLKYDKTQRKGVLGRLFGTVADVVNPTRNNRKYSETLWKKVFSDDLVKEQFAAGGVFGELGHPTDRSETDMTKIAIVMPEPPKENANGELEASVDILDTPNGRIAKCLADYGYKLGISSRGTGEVIESFDGEEIVDENTYDFQAFDLVIIPACKNARLSLVESLNSDIRFKRAICEEIERSTDEEKAVMLESLDKLGIGYKPSTEEVDIDVVPTGDVGGDTVTDTSEALQEALNRVAELEKQVVCLNEKLSVGYAKELTRRETSEKLGTLRRQLSESKHKQSALSGRVKTLTEKNGELLEKLNNYSTLIQGAKSDLSKARDERQQLRESVRQKSDSAERLQNKCNALTERLASTKMKYEVEKKQLVENISKLEDDLSKQQADYGERLSKSNRLVEKYRGVATESMRRYIDLQALRIGVTASEVKNRLNEQYSFDDVDRVCEDLQEYRVNVSKLPINVSAQKVSKAVITESKQPTILPQEVKSELEVDDIDPFLLSLL